jgi:hypothetical protein
MCSIDHRNWPCPRQIARRDYEGHISRRYTGSIARQDTHKKPKRELLVEIDAELNAEHWVDVLSDTHP